MLATSRIRVHRRSRVAAWRITRILRGPFTGLAASLEPDRLPVL